MIIFTGNDEAVSFTDESSPDTRITGEKICVSGQVNRALSLDWYYKIIQLFPDVQGELKSKEVAERFKNLHVETRNAIWAGLGRVKIHIVDPRSHCHRVDNILRRAWKNDRAPQLLAQWEREGLPNAKYFVALVRNMVADSILHDSTAMRVQFLGRVLLDAFGMSEPDESLRPFFASSLQVSRPLISTEDFRKPKSLIRDVTSWSAKSAAVFHSALEAAMIPDENVFATARFTDGHFLRRKMAEQLLPVHAFDDGNQKQLDLLDETRYAVSRELAAHDHVFWPMVKRPGVVPVESKESFYVQAADVAAGIASHIYASEGLIGVMERFEYVTYNGARVSRSDAEEEMGKLGILEI